MLADGLSEGEWVLVGLVVTAIIGPTWLAWWNSRIGRAERADLARLAREQSKQFGNNGGTTMRDAIDRIEASQLAQHRDTVARLNHGAVVMAEFSDRLAVVESRNPNPTKESDPT